MHGQSVATAHYIFTQMVTTHIHHVKDAIHPGELDSLSSQPEIYQSILSIIYNIYAQTL